MDLLFLCAEAPTASQPRPHGLIAALARGGHRVTLLFIDEAGTAFDDLAVHCHTVIPVRRREFRARVHAEGATGAYDLVHVDGPAARFVERLELPTVLDAAVSASLRHDRAIGFLGPFAQLGRLAQRPGLSESEAALIRRFNSVIVAAEEDAAALRELVDPERDSPAPIYVVPNVVDMERFAPPLSLRDPASLLLDLRWLSRAEARAALAMMAATLPIIWRQRAEVRLTIVGAPPIGAASGLAGDPRVVFAGSVHDARGHLASATMALAPLCPAATSCHSALEALATGTALVASRHIAHELGARAGHELMVADTPAQLAAAALALLEDPPYRGQIGRAGRRLAEHNHCWERALHGLEDIYAAVTGSPIAEWRLEVGMKWPRAGE
jgi:glycosyltransferase involved in cell wall biosynthesis